MIRSREQGVTESTMDGRQEVGPRDKRGWVDYLLLAAPYFSTPMLLWAENYVGVGHPGRLLTIGGSAWFAAAVMLATLRRIGVSRVVSLTGIWIFAYVFMRGVGLVNALGYLLAFVAPSLSFWSCPFLSLDVLNAR
jgi:hypothetical protein